jgi:putative SOS response-associated peptidase YedK
MCGRYALYTDVYEWSDLGFVWPFEEGWSWPSNYNVAPSSFAPVVLNLEQPIIARYRWGLVPSWSKDPAMGHRLINARAETITEKPAFREAFKRRRCVVVANGFFEWQKKGQKRIPFYIKPRLSALLGFAGLWEHCTMPSGERLNTFTIMTTLPNQLMAPIHNRMPAILAPEHFNEWLQPTPKDLDRLRSFLAPYPEEKLEAYPVSQFVNNPANNAAECIQSLGDFQKTQ